MGGGRGVEVVAEVFPVVSLPASPAFQVRTTPPTQRGSGGWEGGAGLRAPAPPSITWPESHKNNSVCLRQRGQTIPKLQSLE